jgi:hypothetical protein
MGPSKPSWSCFASEEQGLQKINANLQTNWTIYCGGLQTQLCNRPMVAFSMMVFDLARPVPLQWLAATLYQSFLCILVGWNLLHTLHEN